MSTTKNSNTSSLSLTHTHTDRRAETHRRRERERQREREKETHTDVRTHTHTPQFLWSPSPYFLSDLIENDKFTNTICNDRRFNRLFQYLQKSISSTERPQRAQESGHADTGHQQMSDKMEECIGRIEMMVREDRQKQSLKEGKAHTACGAGSNASQKTQGKGMVNAFALLGTGDDGGSEQEDE
jgi:hypothetical protein